MVYNAVLGTLATLLVASGVAALKADRSLAHVSFSPGTSWANHAWCQPSTNCQEDDISKADVVLVSYYYIDKEEIQRLRNDGKVVVCYMSAGAVIELEEDTSGLPLAKKMVDWSTLIWLDILQYDRLKQWMTHRLKKAESMGCQAIEADNIDCWQNDCLDGYKPYDEKLKKAQIAYVTWLAQAAHSFGMAVGQKNSLALVKDLVNEMDFLINENCWNWKECYYTEPYINAGKAVFGTNTLYKEKHVKSVCKTARKYRISMKYALGNTAWKNC